MMMTIYLFHNVS